MRLPALLVSDTHFVADPSAEYRFGLWPWMRQTIKDEKVKTLVHCGDLVDRKDNHPASLVNRLADEVKKTRAETGVEQVYMAGNHDWLKEGEEFFRFLRHMDGVHYVSEPWEHPDVKGPTTFFLPYSKDPVGAWKNLDFSHYEYLFLHQTVGGSVSSNGEKMSGELLPLLNAGKVYSGDIHVPQVVEGPFGKVEYIGSPFHVHFGDAFRPRVILLEAGGHAVDLHFNTIHRLTLKVSSLDALENAMDTLCRDDQVKLRLELNPEERHDWSRLRRQATNMLREWGVKVEGVELVPVGGDGQRVSNARAARAAAVSPAGAVQQFVRDEELGGDALDVGLELL